MISGKRRLSIHGFIVVLVAMVLVSYVFYDYVSDESKSERRMNKFELATDRLTKMHRLRDKAYDRVAKTSFESTEQEEKPTAQTEWMHSVDKEHTPLEDVEKQFSRTDENFEDTKGDNFEETKDENFENTKSDNFDDTQGENFEDIKGYDKDIREFSKQITGARDIRSKYVSNGTVKGNSIREKSVVYGKTIEHESYLSITNATYIDTVNSAIHMLGSHYNSTIILLSFISHTCLPFVNSWLCNTKELDLHRYVLLVARDTKTKHSLINTWPDIKVVTIQSSLSINGYAQIRTNKSALMLCKLHLVNSLLHAGVSLLLFNVKSVWFGNPLPNFPRPRNTNVDLLVSVAPNSHLNTGFLVLYATKKTQHFWKALCGKLKLLEKKSQEPRKQESIALDKYYVRYLQKMVKSGYKKISVRELPMHYFADDTWYFLSHEERAKTHPVVILNTNAQDNEEKIARARKWNHWFLQHDGACDLELMRKTVKM